MQVTPLATAMSWTPRPRAAAGPVPASGRDIFYPTSMPLFCVSALLRSAIAPVTLPLAGTPILLTLDDLNWPRAAQREAEAHFASRGLALDEPLGKLARTELLIARELDARVQTSDMVRAIDRAESAQRLKPAPTEALFGFTRLTDAKFPLTPRLLEQMRLSDGAEPVVVEGLSAALNGQGASEQLNLDARAADWLTRTLRHQMVFTSQAMGGAGAFCANLAAMQPNVRAAFWALGGLPPTVAVGMHPEVAVVDEQGRQRTPRQAVDPAQHDRVNYIAEYSSKAGGPSGRVILSTPGNQEIGFGTASDEVLRQTIQGKQLFFFAGTHYLTRGDLTLAAELARDLSVMKQANADCLFHLQYVKPKDPANEKAVMDQVAPFVDSMSLNSVEVPALLEHLEPASSGPASGSDREILEKPVNLLAGALQLKQAMGLERVHVHGREGDLVVARTPKDKERTVLALMRARQLASMKANNESGQIAKNGEMWPVLPLVEGKCLAAVQKFADAVQARYGLTESERARVARDWYFEDGQGNTIFFVPSRGIHDRTGGTVSLGDTIDCTALLYSLE
ncbi:hypothetical protein DYH09_26495 [bacterium CPR1]|nr:hypothetical protein [bacterium CPR1]